MFFISLWQGRALLLIFESKNPSHLTAPFNAVVLKRIWLQILIMSNKYSWPNWDQRKSPDNQEIRINRGSTVIRFIYFMPTSISVTKCTCSLTLWFNFSITLDEEYRHSRSWPTFNVISIREFKKLRQQLQWKRHIKIELCIKFSLLRLFHADHFVQNRPTALLLAWYEWFSCKGKDWKIYCCELALSSEPQIWKFHVVV